MRITELTPKSAWREADLSDARYKLSEVRRAIEQQRGDYPLFLSEAEFEWLKGALGAPVVMDASPSPTLDDAALRGRGLS